MTAPPLAPTARPVRQLWLIARPSRATCTARTGAALLARAAAATRPAPDPDALRAPAPLKSHSAGVGRARQDPRREELDRPHELRVWDQPVVGPGEEPAHGQPRAQALELPRHRVHGPHQREPVVEEARRLARHRIGEPFREPERLRPLAAAEEAPVPPEPHRPLLPPRVHHLAP